MWPGGVTAEDGKTLAFCEDNANIIISVCLILSEFIGVTYRILHTEMQSRSEEQNGKGGRDEKIRR